MLRVLWRLTRGYRLCPWRSPYLRWRIETYSGLHAEAITPAQFCAFAWNNRRDLLRYLRWAAKNASYAPRPASRELPGADGSSL